jgi:hypothetical protein
MNTRILQHSSRARVHANLKGKHHGSELGTAREVVRGSRAGAGDAVLPAVGRDAAHRAPAHGAAVASGESRPKAKFANREEMQACMALARLAPKLIGHRAKDEDEVRLPKNPFPMLSATLIRVYLRL